MAASSATIAAVVRAAGPPGRGLASGRSDEGKAAPHGLGNMRDGAFRGALGAAQLSRLPSLRRDLHEREHLLPERIFRIG